MGLKDDLNSITASIESAQPQPPKVGGQRIARTAPGQLFAFSEQSKSMERQLDAALKAAGAPRMLLRTQLRPSPFQTRTISPEQVAELVDNLRENPLTTPIVVREIEPDLFEIIAGHRRNQAFECLGRNEIPAVVVKMTDEQAEGSVLYDNFFTPDICDYEKYLGLKKIQSRLSYTHEQLAEKSGISRTLVTYLMSFDRLPADAHDVLRANPSLIGATAATKLVQLDSSLAPRISLAIQQLADGTLKQAKLIDWICKKTATAKVEPKLVKVGRTVYAKVLRRGAVVTIEFKNSGDAESLEKELSIFLKERASAQK
jgi:ParB family transcriptional regulator, chromosome partitioning protein